MQGFLQLVSQSQQRLGSIFKWRVFIGCSAEILQDKLQEGLLHCALAKTCSAALRQSLRKVEPDSTSCNASCNKNVVIARHVTPCNFACNLCRNKLRNKLRLKTFTSRQSTGLRKSHKHSPLCTIQG